MGFRASGIESPSALLALSCMCGAADSIRMPTLIIESGSKMSFKLFSMSGGVVLGVFAPKFDDSDMLLSLASPKNVFWVVVASANGLPSLD